MSDDKKVRMKLSRHLWPDEQKEKQRKNRTILLMVLSMAILFLVGFGLGTRIHSAAIPSMASGSALDGFSQEKLNSIYNIMRTEWYFGKDIENLDDDLINRALYGMSQSMEDPHSTYMSAEQTLAFSSNIDKNFVGIGIQYFSNPGMKMITRVFADSPAAKAGVQEGDILLKADGISLVELESDEVADLVKGEAGTSLKLTVLRDNEEVTMDIVRAEVTLTAFGEMLDDTTGYLEIISFGSSTGAECARYLQQMSEQGLKELVIDLRDNGGGYLDALVDVVSLFLPENTLIMSREFKDGQRSESYTREGMLDNIEGIVILINENTASASEVLTMALKEQRDDVTLLGTTTYGKGSVQTQRPFADGSVLKYTNSRWLSPKDEWINGVGITPDVVVEAPEVLRTTISSFMMEEGESYTVDQVSEHIATAQKALEFLGYSAGRTDGYFDKTTEKTLKQYQQERNLEVTGILDETTLQSLYSRVRYSWSVDKSVDNQLQSALEILHG